MTNFEKITNYLSIIHQKILLVSNYPHNWLNLGLIVLILVASLWLSAKLGPYLLKQRPPFSLLAAILLPFSAFCGILILALINWLIMARQNIMLHFLWQLMLAASLINLVNPLIRHSFSKYNYARLAQRIIKIMLWTTALVSLTDSDDDIISILDSINLHLSRTNSISLWDLLRGICTLVVVFILAKLLIQMVDAKINRWQTIDGNTRQILIRVLKIVIFVLAFMVTLPLLGIDVTALSVFSGALGVGLGFGLQKIASNFLSGFIILLDRSIKVGDRLVVDNNVGIVSKITTRYVVLERFDGTEVLIPNETFVTSSIQNQSYSSTMLRSEIIFAVSYDCDLRQAISLITQAIEQAPHTIRDKANVLIHRLINNGVEIKAYFWVREPSHLGAASNYIYIEVLKLFKQFTIKTPQSTQTIELIKHHD